MDLLTGYEGKFCTTEIDECEISPCNNGANCTDLVNDYKCECLPGFQGKDCDINIDECASQPCQHNSTCIDQVNRLLSDYSSLFCVCFRKGHYQDWRTFLRRYSDALFCSKSVPHLCGVQCLFLLCLINLFRLGPPY